MAVVPSRAIAPATVEFADRARHRIAMQLLPFLFILYIANYLDRTSVAYAALGMSRDLERLTKPHFAGNPPKESRHPYSGSCPNGHRTFA